MAVKNNAVLGYIACSGCGGRASVHAAERRGRHLYTRCTVCGTDQRAGAPVQTALWSKTEWLPGLKPEKRPANLVSEPVEPEQALGSPGVDDPVLQPEKKQVEEPESEPESRHGLWWLVGGALGVLALVRG